MRGALRGAVGAVGVLATLLGALAVVAPSFVADTEPLATLVGAASGVGPRDLFFLGSAAVGLYLAGSVLQSPDARLLAGDAAASERFDGVVADPPESVTAADRTVTGNAFDVAVERACAGDERALEQVRERLRALAVARFTRAERDSESASRAVAAGEWTDDRTAAAFLSEDDGPYPSIWSRLRLWLDAETERERRIRRTVEGIDALGDTLGAGSEDGGVER
ncbi:DUF7269 family protein [Halosimplex salinum]|uniref:DUF7269 family protein n=1 Tax=Halosimplex salinum TaxID=1710538 RepID=UPI000F492F05|nr:hypothetical protein [Halosimplex salinum]